MSNTTLHRPTVPLWREPGNHYPAYRGEPITPEGDRLRYNGELDGCFLPAQGASPGAPDPRGYYSVEAGQRETERVAKTLAALIALIVVAVVLIAAIVLVIVAFDAACAWMAANGATIAGILVLIVLAGILIASFAGDKNASHQPPPGGEWEFYQYQEQGFRRKNGK